MPMPWESERSMPSISWLRTVMRLRRVRDDATVRVVGAGGLRRLDRLLRDVEHPASLVPGRSAFRARAAARGGAHPTPALDTRAR